MKTQFSREWLPLLGVMWHHFPTEAQATEFADWAESVTQHDARPCHTLVTVDPDAPESYRFEVRVHNW